MAHDREKHDFFINELCRTCGKLNLSRQARRKSFKKYNCDDYVFDMNSAFGVDISSDDQKKHSQYLCRNCVQNMKYITSSKSFSAMQTARNRISNIANIWKEFNVSIISESDCGLCEHNRLVYAGTG